MSNNKHTLVPKLRFPEFQNAGEWEFKVFSEFIKLYRGSSPRPIQNYLTKDESGVNWIKIGDTKNADGFIIKQVEEKITPEGAEKSIKVNIGELILANSMSFGKTYQLAIEGFIYDGWFVLREYEEYFDRQFLLQLLNSDYMQNQYQKFSAGGIVQNISSDIVYSTILSYTSLPEQQKIASCLSSLDEVITGEQQKLELLKQHKKGLLQNLFPQEGETVPKLRFKEFENSGEWEEKKLIQIATYVNDKMPIENLSINSYISTENLLADYAGVTLASKLPSSGNFTKYQKGDILVSNIRPYLKKVWFADKDGACSNDVIVIRSGTFVSDKLLSYLLKNDAFISYIMKGAEGVKMPRGDKDFIKEYPILYPKDKTEQQKIAACLSSLDEIITARTQKIEQLQRHKKGLLQGLFPFVSDTDTDTVETGHALSLPTHNPTPKPNPHHG